MQVKNDLVSLYGFLYSNMVLQSLVLVKSDVSSSKLVAEQFSSYFPVFPYLCIPLISMFSF